MQNRLVLNARGRIQSLVAVETVKSICLPYLYLDLSIFCKSVHTMYWGQTWIAVFASQAAAVIYPPLLSKCSIKKDCVTGGVRFLRHATVPQMLALFCCI